MFTVYRQLDYRLLFLDGIVMDTVFESLSSKTGYMNKKVIIGLFQLDLSV